MRSRALAVLSAITPVVIVAGCADDGPRSPDSALAGVVRIETWRCDEPNRFSGYGVNVGGQIVTAAHLVDGDLREVLVDDEPAVVSAIDERTDLATLHIDGAREEAGGVSVDDVAPRQVRAARSLPAVEPGDEAWMLADASTVLADRDRPDAHHPGEAPGSPVADSISSPDHDDELTAVPVRVVRETRLVVNNVSTGQTVERNAIVFSPSVVEGASGAPLVNATGELVGIVVLSSRSGERAYAVRIDEVVRVGNLPTKRRSPIETRSKAGVCDGW